MSTTRKIEPYLFFEGRTDEAIEFYQKTLGAEVLMLMRFKDSPEPPPPAESGCAPGDPNKVMHACIRIGETNVLLSDGNCGGTTSFQGFSLSLTAADSAEAEKRFKALGEGGNVIMPLGKTFFSPSFGMLTDRFGVMWMVMVPMPE
jgi:PhnB protein